MMLMISLFFLTLGWTELALGSSPIVLMPGLAGSQLWGKQQNASFQVWVSIEEAYIYEKINELLSLQYDERTRTVSNKANISIYVPYYGKIRNVAFLDDSFHLAGMYMHPLITTIMKDAFFKDGETIRGAPYDFRLTPRENKKLIPNLKRLIEETYRKSGNKRVTLLGHSYGVANGLIFLNSMSFAWRKKYISTFIGVAGVLGGSTKALQGEISGENIGLPFKSTKFLRPLQRSMPSMAAILPRHGVWPADMEFVLTDHRNYTVQQYEALFQDLQLLNSYNMWTDSRPMFESLSLPPGIDNAVCIYGTGLSTPELLDYRGGRFPDGDPTVTNGPGDGTVNLRSLQLCHEWPNVRVHVLEKAEHFAIIQDARFIALVVQHLRRG